MFKPHPLLGVAAVVLLLCSACGYHFGSVDSGVSTIAIAMFANSTHEPFLEKDLTNLVISELMRSPAYSPVESIQVSQLSLEGTVTGYASAAVAYDSSDTIKRYLVTVSASVTLREEPSGRVLWKGSADAAEEYAADLDKAVQRQLEEQARTAAMVRLAEEISQRLEQRF